jgi:hypothetical protein
MRPERPRREILLLVSGRDIPEPTPKINNVCAIVTSYSAVVSLCQPLNRTSKTFDSVAKIAKMSPVKSASVTPRICTAITGPKT